MLSRLRSLARALLGRGRFEDDLAEELRFHHEARVDQLISEGMPPEEARRRARLEFGASERVREECRESRGLRWPDTLARNVRFAFRLLRKDPVFAVTTVTTLALCIGANTAVFSLVDAVLFRPLPYPEPQRLVEVVAVFQRGTVGGHQSSQTGRVWEAVRDHVPALDPAVFSDWVTEVNLAAQGRVDQVRQQRVCAGFFRVLGVAPLLGREFTKEEDVAGGPAVAILSHDLWTRLFNADAGIVGRTVLLRGEPYTVVGVLPAGLQTSTRAEVWTPLRPSTSGEGAGSNYLVIGRLKPGATAAQTEAQLAGISRDAMRELDLPPGATARLRAIPLQGGMAEDLRTPLLLLWGAVGFVLLIGCSNVAGLLLARSSQRTQEIATRIALGGGQWAVVGQLLTESLVLALLGGAAGLLVGKFVLAALRPGMYETLGVWQDFGLDWRVLAATAGVAAFTSVAFGLYPALRAARIDVRSALVEGGSRAVAGGTRLWPRRLLVVAEVGLGLALLVGAGLLIRTFAGLNDQPAGVDPHNVLAAQVSLQDARYRTAAAVTHLFDDSLARITQLPGVRGAGVLLTLPYERALNLGFRPMDGRTGDYITNWIYVTPGVVRALGMTVLRGRALAESDMSTAAPVALVNESFVRRYYPGREVVGEHLRSGGKIYEVVGVLRDIPAQSGWGDYGPLAPIPTMYVPAAQLADGIVPLIHTWFTPRWVVRTDGAQGGVIAGMQRALAATDPLLAMTGFRSIDQVRATSLANQRLRAQLLGGLAALAVVLTFVGLYGLIAHTVAERKHEIGIRMALGATAGQLVRQTAGAGVTLAIVGVLLGAGLATAAVPLLQSLLWGVRLLDPLTYGAAAAGLLLVAAVASIVPARRVTRFDPSRMLRSE